MIRFEKVSIEQFKEGLKNCGWNISDEDATEIYKNIKLPQRGTTNSAGYDFFAPFAFNVESNYRGYTTIPTGVRFVTDRDDIFLLCAPRSGSGFKNGLRLRNTIGIIDSDYCRSANEGHIMARLEADVITEIEAGKGFMQGIITPFLVTDDDNAQAVRDGGFGSTDKK